MVRIDRVALPPLFLRPQLGNSEMQMRCVGWHISGCPHVPDYIATPDDHPFLDSGRVMVQMRVIETVDSIVVKLIDRQSPGDAVEQLFNQAVRDGNHRSTKEREDIDSVV